MDKNLQHQQAHHVAAGCGGFVNFGNDLLKQSSFTVLKLSSGKLTTASFKLPLKKEN
jgi:hypothetical protein